jgi:hypothetical protein
MSAARRHVVGALSGTEALGAMTAAGRILLRRCDRSCIPLNSMFNGSFVPLAASEILCGRVPAWETVQ